MTLDLGFSVNSQKPVKKERIDGIKARKDLASAVKNKGGDGECQARVVDIQTEQMFGCDLDTLYEGTGGKKGDRSTLPAEAQKAYQASDSVTAHAINNMPTQKGTQEAKNSKILKKTEQVNKKLSGFFPWH